MYEYSAELVRVIDGDTLILDVDLGFNIKIRERFRLARINAPEISTENGKRTKAFVEGYLFNKKITIQSQKPDKYGRYLAELYANGENLNDKLVKEGLADGI